jgi:hypothetical protein
MIKLCSVFNACVHTSLFYFLPAKLGQAVAQLVEALRYEHEGPNPITVCAIWIFH